MFKTKIIKGGSVPKGRGVRDTGSVLACLQHQKVYTEHDAADDQSSCSSEAMVSFRFQDSPPHSEPMDEMGRPRWSQGLLTSESQTHGQSGRGEGVALVNPHNIATLSWQAWAQALPMLYSVRATFPTKDGDFPSR